MFGNFSMCIRHICVKCIAFLKRIVSPSGNFDMLEVKTILNILKTLNKVLKNIFFMETSCTSWNKPRH